jgi:hypothetical protein
MFHTYNIASKYSLSSQITEISSSPLQRKFFAALRRGGRCDNILQLEILDTDMA